MSPFPSTASHLTFSKALKLSFSLPLFYAACKSRMIFGIEIPQSWAGGGKKVNTDDDDGRNKITVCRSYDEIVNKNYALLINFTNFLSFKFVIIAETLMNFKHSFN